MYDLYDDLELNGGMYPPGIGSLGALVYVPDLAPVGSGAAGTYYPRDTAADAEALNYLGFYPDPLFQAHVGTKGTQQADMAANTGAWDPTFKTAVADFQGAYGLTADGWIGPATRKKLGEEVLKKNLNTLPPTPPLPGPLPIPPGPLPTPPGPLPTPPGPLPTPPGPTPAPAEESHTGRNIAIGVGVLAALGLGAYWLTK